MLGPSTRVEGTVGPVELFDHELPQPATNAPGKVDPSNMANPIARLAPTVLTTRGYQRGR
jgi:hypothetical protein